MDIFQLIGDFLHLVAVLMLLLKIITNKNVLGLSYKTQEMYLFVFLLRYSDMVLENHWGSLYFNAMRFIFIGVTAYTIYLIKYRRPYKLYAWVNSQSYNAQDDAFPHYFLYLAAAALGFILHSKFTLYGILWSLSIWLQAVAILPQLYMIRQIKSIENITAHIVLFLGMYRFFYILHWVYNWDSIIMTSFTAGIIQSVLYADFIYYFIKSNQNDRIIQLLPV